MEKTFETNNNRCWTSARRHYADNVYDTAHSSNGLVSKCKNTEMLSACSFAAWTDEWAEELIEKVIWFKDFKQKFCTVCVARMKALLFHCVLVWWERAAQRKGIQNEFEHVGLLFVYLFVILYRCIVLRQCTIIPHSIVCLRSLNVCNGWFELFVTFVVVVVVVIHRFFLSMNIYECICKLFVFCIHALESVSPLRVCCYSIFSSSSLFFTLCAQWKR